MMRASPHISQSGKAATEPREAFGVRRIPALSIPWLEDSFAPFEERAPGCGALQTLRDTGGVRIPRSARAIWIIASHLGGRVLSPDVLLGVQ